MDAPSAWSRPLYEATDQQAFLLYYVFGKFPAEVAPPRSKYRISEIPPELQVSVISADHPQAQDFLRQPHFAAALDRCGPNLQRAVRKAPSCMIVRGEFADPPSLLYLRDTVGLLAYLTDHGAAAVLDAFRLKWWAPGELQRALFEPDDPSPLEQTLLLGTDQGDRVWLHTRGMRKFARPDVSAPRVPVALREPFVEAMTRLVQVMAAGAVIPDGHPLTWPSLPPGVTCHPGGHLEDPEFHNVHIELRSSLQGPG